MGAGGGRGKEEEQGRKVNVLKGVIIGVLGNRGRAWVDSQTLPPPPHAPLHRRGKLIFFLKRSKKKERSGIASRERASRLPHTPGKQKPTKKIFFSISPPVHPLPVKKKKRKKNIQNLKIKTYLLTVPPTHNTPYPTPVQNKTKTKTRIGKSGS